MMFYGNGNYKAGPGINRFVRAVPGVLDVGVVSVDKGYQGHLTEHFPVPGVWHSMARSHLSQEESVWLGGQNGEVKRIDLRCK